MNRTETLLFLGHEFRTPLAAISSMVELLEISMQRDDLLTPFYRQQIHRITDEIFRLNTMLDEALAPEEVPAVRGPVNAIRVLHDMASLYFSAQKDNRSLQVNVSGIPRDIYADERQLSMILTNLVGNAFKYSRKEDPEASFLYRKDQLEIRITDYGRGIPASDLPFVFSTFYRGSNVTDVAGTGLGLFIVRKLVEENNGHIEVHSEEGRGTTFTISFNYAA